MLVLDKKIKELRKTTSEMKNKAWNMKNFNEANELREKEKQLYEKYEFFKKLNDAIERNKND